MTVKFLLGYSHRPLRVFGLPGLLMSAVGFVLGSCLMWVKFALAEPIGGKPLLLLSTFLMLLGFQFVSLVLLGELLDRSRSR
jgi:hypothetical protein